MAKINFNRLSRVYLDTVIYIYLFEDNPRYAEKTENLFLRLEKEKVEIIASSLLLTELLVAPLRDRNSNLVHIYKNLPNYIPNLRFSPLDNKISTTGAELRAKYGLLPPDAIHIATAVVEDADIFFTADKKITKVEEIRVVNEI